jgi:protein-S-isoprenylcysteine O-methyltransferase Ste14
LSQAPAAVRREGPAAPGRRAVPPLARRIHGRRPLLTALFVAAAIGTALLDPAPPARLLEPSASLPFLLAWTLMLLGAVVRIWGAGNLRKDEEISSTGVYRMLRHPLYLGNLSFLLAFFLAVGDPWVGAALFTALVVVVYYPTMLVEEDRLWRDFPGQAAEYDRRPRLLPDPRRFPEALRSDRFSFGAARLNLGLRGVGFLVVVACGLELLRWVEARL